MPAVGEVWNGSAFVAPQLKIWDGSAFADSPPAWVWDGSAFQKVWPVGPQFDAVGAGGSHAATGAVTTATWSHTASGSDLVVLVTASYNASVTSVPSGLTRTATYGGVAMTSLGLRTPTDTDVAPYVELFALFNPPTGAQTVSITAAAGAGSVVRRIIGNSVSYTGVGSLGTFATGGATTGTAMSHTVSAAAGQLVHQVFMAVSTISGYNQTSRYNATLTSAPTIQIGDAAGASSVVFSATRGASGAWASVAVPLLP